jgi:hypothetical protein
LADLPETSRFDDNPAWHVAVLIRRGWTARIIGEGEQFGIPRNLTLPVWQDGQIVQIKGAEIAAPYALLLTSPLNERIFIPMNDGQFVRDLLRRAAQLRVRATDVTPAKP